MVKKTRRLCGKIDIMLLRKMRQRREDGSIRAGGSR